jgi:outer membrane protein OmpA-like peptidoglycan-associated protein
MATNGRSESGGTLSSSLTDLMTSLMVIFVLLLVATLNNASAEGENTRNIMLDQLKIALQDFAAKGVRVEKDPTDPLGLLILVPEKFFNFAVDKSDIPSGGSEFLERFVPRLAATACSQQYKSEISSIVVEGHTDSTGTDEHNLKLSQERSLAVVQQTLNVLASQDDGEKACFLDFISANGRGSREPILDERGLEDRDRSRRVIFKIRVRSLEQREIRKLLGM